MNLRASLMLVSVLLLFATCRKEEEHDGVIPVVHFPADISEFETEDNSVFSFPLVLDATTNRDVSVTYETKPLTATEGQDYVSKSGTLVFPAGTAAGTIAIDIVIDSFLEEDEAFRVVLTGSDGVVFKDGFQEAIGTIRNDDSVIAVEAGGYEAADEYPGKSLVWSDEFNGPEIDLNNWTYDLGGGGWGNQEWQIYTNSPNNAYVANGNLMIVALDNGFQYTSARMKSIGLQEFQHGRIDVRALLPTGQGIWPAIWMLGGNFPNVGWPACGEIDIMELVGNQPNVVHGTVHYGNDWSQHQYTGGSTYLPFGESFADEFHVFSIEWDETGIRWLLDDQQYFQVNQDVTGAQNYPFNNDFFFILNVAVGGIWPGYPDDTTVFPNFMAVDYVRVYQ